MTPLDAKLIQFARWVIAIHRSDLDPRLGEVDGADIQDKLIELGILESVTVTAPCGEDCRCAKYYGKEFPADCLRLCKDYDDHVEESRLTTSVAISACEPARNKAEVQS